MSRFPVIDSPCRLRFASMPQAGRDHCGHCDRQVHNLDGMNNAQRQAFMSSCGDKVCVAYTVHRRAVQRNVTLGMGLAATMLSSAAMAGQLLPDSSATAPSSPVSTATEILPDDTRTLERIELTGGVVNPGEARWSDESDIATPDTTTLPEIGETDWLPSKTTP